MINDGKLCVLINGTNGVGKSSLVNEILTTYGGGVAKIENNLTYCRERKVCAVGEYKGQTFGGADRIKNKDGVYCTSELHKVVKRGLETCNVVIFEGAYFDSFGINMTNALFQASNRLVVSLLADANTLVGRLRKRSGNKGGRRGDGHVDFAGIMKKQNRVISVALKWRKIGVRVLPINTTSLSVQDVCNQVIEAIETELNKI